MTLAVAVEDFARRPSTRLQEAEVDAPDARGGDGLPHRRGSEQLGQGRRPVEPNDGAFQVFDSWIMALLVFIFIFLPVELAFEEIGERDIRWLGLCFDLIFCLDIVKTFNAGFPNERDAQSWTATRSRGAT